VEWTSEEALWAGACKNELKLKKVARKVKGEEKEAN